MKNYLTFRGIQTDTIYFKPGETLTETALFQERHGDSLNLIESLDTASHNIEPEVVRWILKSEDARNLLFNEIKLTGNIYCADAISAPIVSKTNEKPGDIDLIAYKNCRESIAFQCKLVNVKYDESGNEVVNKIEKLGNIVSQSNKTREMGFYQTYAVIICVVDGRRDNNTYVLHRGVRQQSFKRLYQFPYRESLHDGVGLIFVELIQPTGVGIQDCGYVFVATDKFAGEQEQSESLTTRVLEANRLGKFSPFNISLL